MESASEAATSPKTKADFVNNIVIVLKGYSETDELVNGLVVEKNGKCHDRRGEKVEESKIE